MNEPKKLPFVWELDYDGVISNTIGTMHAVRNIFGDDITAKLDGKTNLLLECTPDAMASHGQAILDILFENYNDSERNTFLNAFGTDYDTLRQLNPAHLYSCLFNPTNYRDYPAVDFVCYEKARSNNIQIIGLETPQEKLDWLRQSQLASMFKLARQDLQKACQVIPGLMRFGLELLMNAYENGHESLPFGRPQDTADSSQRNQKMVERSLTYLHQPSVVAVGLDHFIAAPTIIDLYQEKGIKVKRVQ